MSELILKEKTRAIIGAAMEVFNQLGSGFLEAVYQEAMEIELRMRGVVFEAMKPLTICYKGVPLKKLYVADLICEGPVLVELKAIETLTSRDEAQLLNYLKATGIRVGLIINFGGESLEWKRMVR